MEIINPDPWIKEKYNGTNLVLTPKGENKKFMAPILNYLGEPQLDYKGRCLHRQAVW